MFKIIAAAVTPFTKDGAVDIESAERLYQWYVQEKLDGIFLFGNMGEWQVLDSEQRYELLDTACRVKEGKTTIFAGINHKSVEGILHNIDRLRNLKQDYYVFSLPEEMKSDDDVVSVCKKIADYSEKPLFLYYVPQVNGIKLNLGQFEKILSLTKIKGIKNSAGSMRLRKELLRLKKSVDFLLFEGEEWCFDEACILGCDGAIAGFGSAGVRVFKEIREFVRQLDYESALKKQSKLIDLLHIIYGDNIDHPRMGQKYLLCLMGILSTSESLIKKKPNLSEYDKKNIEKCFSENKRYFPVFPTG
jgi:dihydrodipicolinate synthase/N-acetylneuraminate lyase